MPEERGRYGDLEQLADELAMPEGLNYVRISPSLCQDSKFTMAVITEPPMTGLRFRGDCLAVLSSAALARLREKRGTHGGI